jgi:LmbE family N-acetylglucosaminyl deacetylase
MGVHLFLSPHLDDAVLSCGGVIHRLRAQGERVIIVTAMAGDPSAPLPESPVLQSIRAQWNGAEESVLSAVAARRAEDAQAAYSLGAQVFHLPFSECAFRKSLCGIGDWVALYPEHDSPFASISDADEARVALLEMRLPFADITMLYAPLCVDNHVDHRLVRDWALVLSGYQGAPPLRLYEEYPHARNKTALQRVYEHYRKQLPALAMEREVTSLDEVDLAAKLSAMRCYGSHLRVLWNDAAEMERVTRDYMQLTGSGAPAERYWRVVR